MQHHSTTITNCGSNQINENITVVQQRSHFISTQTSSFQLASSEKSRLRRQNRLFRQTLHCCRYSC